MIKIGVVKSKGKWKLEKKKDGVYNVNRRNKTIARIVTDEYEPSAVNDESVSAMMDTFEVKDFKAAKRKFKKYVDQRESKGKGLF